MLGESVFAVFEAKGYRRHPAAWPDDIALLEKRIEGGTPCHCNERCTVHARVHAPIPGSVATVSIEIVGEYRPGQWTKIQVYSIQWGEVTGALVDRVENDVVRAWNAMHSREG